MKLKNVTSDAWEFIVEHPAKQKQGIHLYYKGVPYPRRVYFDWLNDPNYFLRALEALGTVKKFLYSLLQLPKLVIPRTLNIKKYHSFLYVVNEMCWWKLEEFYLKDDEWSVPVWEIGKLVRIFLLEIGVEEKLAIGFSKTMMAILEYDCAYRYRFQDLLGESSKELLQNPFKEFKRLLEIYEQREETTVVGKIRKMINIRYIFLVPKFKKAFRKAIEQIDIEKIKLDINDRYYVSYWRGYNYFGQDFDQRYQFFLDTHKGDFPPFRKREDPALTAKFLTE